MSNSLTVIHPDAKIGENVQIGPFTQIYGDVEIGEGTWIASNVTIMDGARIGKNCKIFPGAVISAIPQDLKFAGEVTYVHIGDSTTIRECATVNRGTAARGKTIVGNNCLLMAYTHLGHDCELGNHVIIGNATQVAGEVEIDDFAIISANCGIHQFTRIGGHVMIQGLSGVGKDVPPYIMAGRNPLAFAGLNVIGLRRRQFDADKINEIHEIYRIIYQSGRNVSEAIKHIEETMTQTAERDEIIDFIKNSKRGIIRGLVS